MIRVFTESTVEDTAPAWLKSTGGRGANYHLPGDTIPTPEYLFGTAPAIWAASSPHLTGSFPHLDGSSPDLDGRWSAEGCLLSDWLPIGKPDVECYVTESAP